MILREDCIRNGRLGYRRLRDLLADPVPKRHHDRPGAGSRWGQMVLQRLRRGRANAVAIARYVGTCQHALAVTLNRLCVESLVAVDDDGLFKLTEKGEQMARPKNPRKWTPEETRTLRSMWMDLFARGLQPKDRCSQIAAALNRSPGSIREKAVYLGLPVSRLKNI